MDDTDDIVIRPDGEGDWSGANTSNTDSVVDDLREMPVGVNDPNIVGNVGPTDIPPGTDPRGAGELELQDDQRPTSPDEAG
ncbi:MAG: hypothetical protein QOK43_93 [Acidimicrobiaceae bacterium]|jgi:hypothetical protein|nr:hypothetical protein [Acidimicrobiaceae bacterium]MDQ1443738.1 hypothetical protein [Acidimicrobiaceae bacterium]